MSEHPYSQDSLEPRRIVSAGPRGTASWWQKLCGLGVLVIVWWIIAALIGLPLILPTPPEVLIRWGELASTGSFWLITATSLVRILVGFGAGMVVGVLLALLMHWHRAAQAIFGPVITIIRATPVVSFIIIALIFIQTPFLPSCIAFLMVAPVACENTEAGLSSVDPALLEMAFVFGWDRWRRVRYIYGPALKPSLLSAAVTCLGLAWKSGVTAEVIASPVNAIGRQLDQAKVYLQTPDLFAWTLTLIGLSLALEGLLKALVARMQKPRMSREDQR